MRPVLCRVLGTVLWCAAVTPAFAQNAPTTAKQGAVVGEIIQVSDSTAVWLTHANGAATPAGAFQPVYDGDTIAVRAPGATARLEMAAADGGTVTVSQANSPYKVHSKTAEAAPGAALAGFWRQFGFVFNPPSAKPHPETSAMGLTDAHEIAESPYLPKIPQHLRSHEEQTLVVAWNGPAADVSLADTAGSVVARTASGDKDARPGFALVHCRPLAQGTYTLEIKAPSNALTIVVLAVNDLPPPHGGYTQQALEAAQKLSQAQLGAQLQALSDLQAVSNEVYLAKALVEAVRQGRTD
jgi:hypothetical protein